MNRSYLQTLIVIYVGSGRVSFSISMSCKTLIGREKVILSNLFNLP